MDGGRIFRIVHIHSPFNSAHVDVKVVQNINSHDGDPSLFCQHGGASTKPGRNNARIQPVLRHRAATSTFSRNLIVGC